MDNYTFIQISDDNYHYTQTLYQQSFGLKQSLSAIKKKYDTSSFGHKNIGYFAVTSEQEPAAYYGVFPMVMTINSKNVEVAQSGDTMTAPDHRGKGLFIQLAKKAYQLAEEKGMKLVFGFPNENSFPGFQKKLDWHFFGSMQKFSIINPVIPLCEIVEKFTLFSATYHKYCGFRLSKYQVNLNEENIAPFNVFKSYGSVKKDLSFFRYKLNNADNLLIKINGFTMLIKPRTHLFIGEVGLFEVKRTGDFIKTLKKLSKILCCRKTIIIISKNFWLYNYLKPVIEPTDNLPIGFLPFTKDIKLADITFTQADYDTF